MSGEYVPPHMRRRGLTSKPRNKQMDDIMKGNGPLGIIMLMIMDTIMDMILDFIGYFYIIFKDGMDLVHHMTFGQYNGMFGSTEDVEKYGSCFTWKYMRYFITLITPPAGIFLSKGIKGWFSIVLCILLCYFHYAIGIVYAFVITHSNRYADRYEENEWARIQKLKASIRKDEDGEIRDMAFFIGLAIMIALFVGLIAFMVKMA